MKLEYFLQIFEKIPNIKFHEIGLVGFLLFHAERGAGRRTDIHRGRYDKAYNLSLEKNS